MSRDVYKRQVLASIAKKTDFDIEIVKQPFGGAGIDAEGHPLPDETLKAARRCV